MTILVLHTYVFLNVCPLVKCMWVHVEGDVEVHEKLSKMKDDKHTNFDMTMNIFSLAISSPIHGYMSEAVHGERLRELRMSVGRVH